MKGHVVFKIMPSVLHQVSTFKSIYLAHQGAMIPYVIEHIASLNKDLVKLKLSGVSDQQAAEALRGSRVYQSSDLLDLDKQVNLVGFTVKHQNNVFIGEIIGINDSTAQILLEVVNGEKEHFIPLVDAFIDRVDESEHTLWMNLPDGILDI